MKHSHHSVPLSQTKYGNITKTIFATRHKRTISNPMVIKRTSFKHKNREIMKRQLKKHFGRKSRYSEQLKVELPRELKNLTGYS